MAEKKEQLKRTESRWKLLRKNITDSSRNCPLEGIKKAAVDLVNRTGRKFIMQSVLDALEGSFEAQNDKDGTTRCYVSKEKRGMSQDPVISWRLGEGKLDADAGITITIDTTGGQPGEFARADYHYDLDGTFRLRESWRF